MKRNLRSRGQGREIGRPQCSTVPQTEAISSFSYLEGDWGGAEFFRGYFKWFFLPAEGDERLPEWDLTFCMPRHQLPERPIEFLPNEEELCFCTVAEFTENSPIFLLISWKTSSLRVCMGFSGRQLILSPCVWGAHHTLAFGSFCPGATWSLQHFFLRWPQGPPQPAVNSGRSRSSD